MRLLSGYCLFSFAPFFCLVLVFNYFLSICRSPLISFSHVGPYEVLPTPMYYDVLVEGFKVSCIFSALLFVE